METGEHVRAHPSPRGGRIHGTFVTGHKLIFVNLIQALGWLSLFLPTQQVRQLDADWNAWAEEWLTLWGSMAHSGMWNNIWMHLFSRLAKHDTCGAVSWSKYMPQLFTHIMWAFPVPVGTATAQMPFGTLSILRITAFECFDHRQEVGDQTAYRATHPLSWMVALHNQHEH